MFCKKSQSKLCLWTWLCWRPLQSLLQDNNTWGFYCKEYILFTGPLSGPPRPTETLDPCNPSPCGSNAICQRRRNAGACQCIPEYFGDPYVACRPECVVHSDCPSNKACQRNKCIDPCPGTCGINARCRVMNHVATCTCIESYIGDPFTACKLKPLRK